MDRAPGGRVVRRDVVHANPYFRVVTARVEMASGAVLDPYYFAEYLRESVAVVPVRGGREALLGRAWRPVTGESGWEVPAGLVEEGEVPEDAARRELLEETGWEAGDLRALGSVYPSNATSTERIHLFVAADPRLRHPVPDEREIGEIGWRSATDISELIRSRRIGDGVSLTALLLAFHLGHLRA